MNRYIYKISFERVLVLDTSHPNYAEEKITAIDDPWVIAYWEGGLFGPEAYNKALDLVRRLNDTDDPNLDSTDGAHPAWWRGSDYGFDQMIVFVNQILDGEDNRIGKFQPDLQILRDRLNAVRDLMFCANRVWSKYGSDKDWQEWLDVKNALERCGYVERR